MADTKLQNPIDIQLICRWDLFFINENGNEQPIEVAHYLWLFCANCDVIAYLNCNLIDYFQLYFYYK